MNSLDTAATVHITKYVVAEGALLAVFDPQRGWAGPIVGSDGRPQLYPGREVHTCDLQATSPADAARQLSLVLAVSVPPT